MNLKGRKDGLGVLLRQQFHIAIRDLQDTTLALDFRFSVLEQNGGGDWSSSVEVTVETLKGTVLSLAGIPFYMLSPFMSCDSLSCSFV